jgi:hypothetical protein
LVLDLIRQKHDAIGENLRVCQLQGRTIAIDKQADAFAQDNRAANWYLSQGRFNDVYDIEPQPDEEVLPGLQFGQLDKSARERLLALLRH